MIDTKGIVVRLIVLATIGLIGICMYILLIRKQLIYAMVAIFSVVLLHYLCRKFLSKTSKIKDR